jgi:membrane fusion protein (multidrug efflux system)
MKPMKHTHVRWPHVVLSAGLLTAMATPQFVRAEDEAPAPEVAVRVAPIARATVRAFVTAYGAVEPEPATADRPAAAVTLAAPSGGLLAGVAAVEGARVAKGDVLVRFDARLADASLEKARVALGHAETVLARQKKLVEIDGTSLRSLQEAEQAVASARQEVRAAEADCSLLEVTAPIDGIVTRVFVRTGETAEAGRPLVALADPARLVVSAAVPLREAATLKTGDQAEVVAAAGGEAVAATVAYISPEAVAGADTVAIRLALPKDSGLRPGQFATARIVAEERKDRLVVPYESLYTDHDGKSAVSLAVDGRSKRVEVTRGLRDGNVVEISGEGIEAGATVITVGSYALPDGTKLRVIGDESKEAAK